MNLSIGYTTVLFTLLLSIGTANAAEQAESTFSAPAYIYSPTPDYPPTSARRGQEGWVEFTLKVDAEGKPFDAEVVSASGGDLFINEARRALARSEWQPARENGVTTEGTAAFIYRLALEGSPREVRRAFKSQYDLLTAMIESQDKDSATAALSELMKDVTLNNFESALLNTTGFQYLTAFGGSDEEKLLFLRNALVYESYPDNIIGGEGFLPPSIRDSAMTNLFMLEVNTRRYGDALITYNRLEEYGVDVTSMAGAVERILALQLDDTAFIQQGEANAFGIWRQRLLKPGVYIESTQGAIREVRFTCDRKHQSFLHQEGVEYTIPDSWGSCGIEIRADGGARFTLEQFRE